MIDRLEATLKRYNEIGEELANPDIISIFEEMPDISIDYGLMEKTDRVSVIKSNFYWDDLGSWDSLFRARKADENGNIIEGDVEIHNVNNSIIINKTKKKFISTAAGLDGMVIINTDDSLIVVPVKDVQSVKNIVNLIKSKNKNEWL